MKHRILLATTIIGLSFLMGGIVTSADYISVEEQIRLEDEMAELELLAMLVRAESGNQPSEGKQAVAGVVLNRVDDPRFPNTITEVIYQKNQFSVVKDGALDRAAWTVDESDYQAVAKELAERKYKDALFFRAGRYHSGRTSLYKIGGHYFSR